MKIQYMSDLHLEFGRMELPPKTGDVLVLAGDILVADHLRKSEASPLSRHAGDYDHFMEYVERTWSHVLFVCGNHEHYKGDVRNSLGLIRARYPFLVTMENELVLLGGVRFYGGTCWTDFDRGSPITMSAAQYGMNDFRIIKNGTNKLRPEYAAMIHADFKIGLEKAKPDVVISHHAPSFESISPEYVNDSLNGAYASELDMGTAKLWIHGHIHANNDYMKGDCRVVSNPRGYYNYAENRGFDPGAHVVLG
jgi:hypothetical protein